MAGCLFFGRSGFLPPPLPCVLVSVRAPAAAVVALVGGAGREATAKGNTDQGDAAPLTLRPFFLFQKKKHFLTSSPKGKKREEAKDGHDAHRDRRRREGSFFRENPKKKEGPHTGNRQDKARAHTQRRARSGKNREKPKKKTDDTHARTPPWRP